MAARKPSGHQSRGWSDDSTNNHSKETTQEKSVPTLPLRSPSIPPSGLRAQEDSGFVRFLRKHSSPTHQRVTAGGRIVPMNKPSSPPSFSINSKGSNSCIREELRGSSGKPSVQNSIHTEQRNVVKLPFQQRTLDNPTSPALRPSLPSSLTSLMWPRLQPSQHSIEPHGGFVPNDCSQPWIQGTTFERASNVDEIGSATTHLTAYPQSPSDWHCVSQEMISQQMTAAHKSLCYWSQCYEELDVQLKALDRQRAMTVLTAEMASQRKTIVQQRSDTKDIIRKISAFLGMSEKASAIFRQEHFNADAPVYVPKGESTPFEAAVPLRKGAPVTVRDSSYIQPPGARRPIPIVAPPELKSKKELLKRNLQQPEEKDDTDQWSVRLGKAPPDLQKRQSEIMDAMTQPNRESHTLPLNIHEGKQLPFRSFSENDAYPSSCGESSSDTETYCTYTNGRAPPAVEADYMKQLDAMRLPKGTRTAVQLTDGSTMTIEGQNLQRPSSTNMSEFEELYWSNVPQSKNTTFPLTPSSDMDQDDCLVVPSAATGSIIPTLQPTEDDGKNHEALTGKSQPYCTPDPSKHHISTWRPTGVSERTKFEGSIRPQQNAYDHFTLDHDGTLIEGLGNKGYSSLKLQSIHAAAPFPFLDGTSEPGRGAKSLLGITNKAKSPRVLQRTGQGGNIWFGPFRRGLGD